MEHIKTPVRMSEWGNLLAAGELLATGHGPQRVQEMGEIRDVLNAHDALIAQRDALVKACELLCIAGERYSKESDYTSGRFIMDVAVITAEARAALALVREDDNALNGVQDDA